MLGLLLLRDGKKNTFSVEGVSLISQLMMQTLLIEFSWICGHLLCELMKTASNEHRDNPFKNK